MRPSSIQRLIISTSDLQRALVFYEDVLALGVTDRTAGFAHLCSSDGTQLLLHERAAAPSDAAVAIGFCVSDLTATVAAWSGRGGAIVDPPADQPWGEAMATVRDADGHLVCLSQAPAREQELTGEAAR